MAIEQMRRILTEAFTGGDVDALDEIMTSDFVNHNAPPGLDKGVEGVKNVIRMERNAFPDLRYEIIRELEDGDFVIQHVTVTGTHRGEIFGVAATGKRVQWNEIHIAKVRDGRCCEHWACNDMASLWVQIGRAEAPRVRIPAAG